MCVGVGERLAGCVYIRERSKIRERAESDETGDEARKFSLYAVDVQNDCGGSFSAG